MSVQRDVTRWRELIGEYGRLRRLEEHTPQSRGRRFNELIAELLGCWGIDASTSVRTTGEVDVAFAHAGVRFVLEAKWEKDKADTGHIAKLQKRVRQRLAGTYGVFLSMSGYSPGALADVADGERLEVLLLDAAHWEAMLGGLVPPEELLSLVRDRAAFYGEPYAPLAVLLSPRSKPPRVDFGPPSDMADDPLRGAVDGVTAEVVLSGIESDQLGIACHGQSSLLVTTAHGILDIDLETRTSKVAVPVAHCHRNPMYCDDGSILFTRRHGVGRFGRGEVTSIGGGAVGNSSLLRHPDGGVWLFDNGTLIGGAGASVTELADRVGDETRHDVAYPAASAFTSAWVSATRLVTIGNSDVLLSSVLGDGDVRHRAPQSNPMGIAHLGHGVILTAGDDVTLCRTDTTTWTSCELAELAVAPSVNELALADNHDVYLAAYQRTTGTRMIFAVIRVRLPDEIRESTRDLPSSTLVPPAPQAKPDGVRLPTRDSEPSLSSGAETPDSSAALAAPSQDLLDNAVGTLTAARHNDRDDGYADALRTAPSLTLHALEGPAHHDFDIPKWLVGWINGWVDIEMGRGPAGASVPTWLPVLADRLGNVVNPLGYDRWSFSRSDDYASGFTQGLRDV